MAHPDSPQVFQARDRRRAERVRTRPLRVRLHRTCEGLLIDISERGALVRLPTVQVPTRQVTLQLEWDGDTLRLRARVVRSVPHRVQLPAAVLARIEHDVGLEFEEVRQENATALRHMIRQEQEGGA